LCYNISKSIKRMSGNKSRIKRFATPVLLTALVVFVGLTSPNVAFAAEGVMGTAFNSLAILVVKLLLWAANIISSLGLWLMEILLVPVVSYSNFIDHPVVTTGWALTRDIVNIGFIAVLLMIAFGTMFGVSRINWRQQIPTLLIGAIAVNFSRLIVGLLIDVGQVIMIAFVNAIQHVGAGNFIKLLSFDAIQQLSANSDGINALSLLGAAALALMMSVIICVIILMMVAILAYRIVILWVLIITAPIAFLIGSSSGVFKSVGGEYGEWWNKLVAAITVGPVMLFFLWLALASVSGGSGIADDFFSGDEDPPSSNDAISASGMDIQSMTSFIIAIALLMAGMEAASRSANQLGGLAAKASAMGSKYANAAISAPVQLGGWAGRKTTAKAKSSVKSVVGDLRTWNLDRTSEGRQQQLNNKKASLQETAATGSRGARIRARRKIKDIDKELSAEKVRMAEAVEGQKGQHDGSTLADVQATKEKLGKSKDINDIAAIRGKENAFVGNSKMFESSLQRSPVETRKVFKDVYDRAKDNDDEAMLKKLDAMIETRPSLGGADRTKLASKFADMDSKAIGKVNVTEFDDPDVLAAALDSGLFQQVADDPGLYKKSLRDVAKKFTGTTGAPNAARVSGVQNDFERQRESILTSSLSDEDRATANRRNAATRDLLVASASGNASSALDRGTDLADVDASRISSADIVHLMENATADSMGKLAAAIRENSASGSADANLTEWGTKMGALPPSYRPTGAKEQKAFDANRTAMNQTASTAYDYDRARAPSGTSTASGAFTGPRADDNRRGFKQAVTSQREMVLHLETELNVNGGNNELSKTVAETIDVDALKGVMEDLDASRGSDGEAQQIALAEQMGRIAEQWEGKMTGELKEQVDKAAQYYRKRVRSQLV
jgi:hypothetical protein